MNNPLLAFSAASVVAAILTSTPRSLSKIVPVPSIPDVFTVPELSTILVNFTVIASSPSAIASSLVIIVIVFASPTTPVNVNVASLSV